MIIEPTIPLYKQGDVVLLDGQVTTLKSWPAENYGYFAWERVAIDGALTQGTGFYGQDEAGEPLTVAAQIETYDGPTPANSIGIDAETGLPAVVPQLDEVSVPDLDEPETEAAA